MGSYYLCFMPVLYLVIGIVFTVIVQRITGRKDYRLVFWWPVMLVFFAVVMGIDLTDDLTEKLGPDIAKWLKG